MAETLFAAFGREPQPERPQRAASRSAAIPLGKQTRRCTETNAGHRAATAAAADGELGGPVFMTRHRVSGSPLQFRFQPGIMFAPEIGQVLRDLQPVSCRGENMQTTGTRSAAIRGVRVTPKILDCQGDVRGAWGGTTWDAARWPGPGARARAGEQRLLGGDNHRARAGARRGL